MVVEDSRGASTILAVQVQVQVHSSLIAVIHPSQWGEAGLIRG